MVPEDVYELVGVSDPRLSPDGRRVAYVVTTIDREENKYRSAIWVVPIDGSAAAAPVHIRATGATRRRDGHPTATACLRLQPRRRQSGTALRHPRRRRRSAQAHRSEGERRESSTGRPTARASRSLRACATTPTTKRTTASARPATSRASSTSSTASAGPSIVRRHVFVVAAGRLSRTETDHRRRLRGRGPAVVAGRQTHRVHLGAAPRLGHRRRLHRHLRRRRRRWTSEQASTHTDGRLRRRRRGRPTESASHTASRPDVGTPAHTQIAVIDLATRSPPRPHDLARPQLRTVQRRREPIWIDDNDLSSPSRIAATTPSTA